MRAAIITPVESSAAYLARFTDDSDLPRYSGGSAPTLALSRPSQCSLTLRPARSADPLRGLSIEVLQIIRRRLIRSDRFRLEREFAGPDFHRGERCANVISPRPKRAAAQLRQLMNVPDRAFERALGMSPAALAECAEAAIRIPADLQATAPGQPQPMFNFILGPNSRGRPSGSQERNGDL